MSFNAPASQEFVTAMGDAQDAYKAMLRDFIAPALRAEGLKGSGESYELRGEASMAEVAFDRSAGNTDDRLRFRVWLSARPADEPANSRLAPGGDWSAALTELVPARPAFAWWLLRDKNVPEHRPAKTSVATGETIAESGQIWPSGHYDTADPASVAADVIDALQRWGLPALRSAMRRWSQP